MHSSGGKRWQAFWSRHRAWLVVALAYLPFCWLFSVSLTGDQKVHFSHAMEMRERGEWIYPLLFGETSYFKPPLEYWTLLASWKIFGFNWGASVLPSILALVGTCALIPRLTRSQGPLAAWLFAGTIGSLMFGTTAQMEIWLALGMSGIAYTLTRFTQAPRQRYWVGISIVIAGVMGMLKSPAYSVVLLSGIWLFLRWQGPLRELLRRPAFWAAHGLSALLGGGWYAYVAATDWARVAERYLKQEHASKLAGNGITILQMFGEFWMLCLPWAPLLALAMGIGAALTLHSEWKQNASRGLSFSRFAKSLRRSQGQRLSLSNPANELRFALALPLLAFFIVVPYRMDTYLFILLPLICAWLADLLESPPTKSGPRSRAQALRIALQATGALATIAILILAPVLVLSGIASRAAGAAFIGVALLYAWSALRARLDAFAIAGILLVTVIRLSAVRIGEQDIAGLRAWASAHPEKPIAFYDATHDIWHEVGYLSIGIGRAISRVHTPAEASQSLQSHAVLVDNFQAPLVVPKILAGLEPGDDEFTNRYTWKRWKRGIYKITPQSLSRLMHPETDEWQATNQKEFTLLWW